MRIYYEVFSIPEMLKKDFLYAALTVPHYLANLAHPYPPKKTTPLFNAPHFSSPVRCAACSSSGGVIQQNLALKSTSLVSKEWQS